VVGGFYGTTPLLRDLIMAGSCEGYNLPQGQLALMHRATAAGHPGVLTHVGLDTFVDPRVEGGKMNARTTEDLVEVLRVGGRDWLLYKSIPVDVALIRATSADELGNLSVEREAVRMETLALATAARNSGGIVIAQVERLVRDRSIPAQRVEVPGHLVDVVVVAERPEQTHQQTLGEGYNPAYSGEVRIPAARMPALEFGVRKVIARRAAMELAPGMVVNLGQGMPEGIGLVASEQGLMESLWTSFESGVIGGVPVKHVNFGVAINPVAIIRHDEQFTFYNGGGIDASFLGFAQVDGHGSVNVSKFKGQVTGCGGFIDICQRTRRLIFCGQFDAGRADVEIADGRVAVRRHGTHRKFVRAVEQITFNGLAAVREGRSITLVTERCVFELRPDGWHLTEVAPGVHLEEDVLAQMDFRPHVGEVRTMDPAIFRAHAGDPA
jgi:propionate CoA-transferase